MKKYMQRILSITLLGFLLVPGTSQTAKAQDVTVSYQTFYDNLAPYGQWIYDPEYGNVWVPNEDGNFRPYGSRGQWVMTEYGNTWVSDDPWGWAVYHYGRWTYNPYYGWIWVPGYEWAPAWVSWRFGGGNAGWAPLGPGVNSGVGYYAPDNWWVFVGPQYMYQPNCIRYWRGPSYNTTYIRQTTIINNYYVDNTTRVRYNYGPRAEVIQQVTRQPVQVYSVSQLNRPGAPSIGRNSVSIYRPSVNRASVNDARPGNVMQAPRSIGRGQAVATQGSNHQPAFRQDMQRTQPANRGGRDNNVQTNPGGNDRTNRFDSRTQQNQPDRQDGRTQPNRYDTRQDVRTQPSQPDRQDSRTQPNRYDTRQDTRTQQSQPDRQDSRTQPNRYDTRQDTRTQQSQPDRQDSRMQPSRYDNRLDGRTQQSQPDRQDTRQQQAPATRSDNRVRMSQPDRQENRQQAAPQPNRSESRATSRPQMQQDRTESRPQMTPQRDENRQPGGRR
ncbi:MAG: hypothetical protein K9G49_11965 [Taibaiella sp.]|nr:hypothetical protein [Taibaiella sp.]